MRGAGALEVGDTDQANDGHPSRYYTNMKYRLVDAVGQSPAGVRCPPNRERTTAIFVRDAVIEIGDHHFHVAGDRRDVPAQHDRVMTGTTVENRTAFAFQHCFGKLRCLDLLQIQVPGGRRDAMGLQADRLDRAALHGQTEALKTVVSCTVYHGELFGRIRDVRTYVIRPAEHRGRTLLRDRRVQGREGEGERAHANKSGASAEWVPKCH